MENEYTFEDIDKLIYLLSDFQDNPYNIYYQIKFEDFLFLEEKIYGKKRHQRGKNPIDYLEWRLHQSFYSDWIFLSAYIPRIIEFVKCDFEDIPLFVNENPLKIFIKWRLQLGI